MRGCSLMMMDVHDDDSKGREGRDFFFALSLSLSLFLSLQQMEQNQGTQQDDDDSEEGKEGREFFFSQDTSTPMRCAMDPSLRS